ncbi:galactokinase-like [Choristoneura fumiferana]|uniref:galactokinase-like n=1 Tax=Choristoneura fumiferana TaxID=7141 RepID=UPI003D155110
MPALTDAVPAGEAALLRRARDEFAAVFARGATVAAAAPGRVNLMGDHVDYCEGYVLPVALPFLTVMVGAPSNSGTCRVVSVQDSGRQEASFPAPTAANPLKPGEPAWANYVKGVVANFPGPVEGFDAVIVSDLPMGAGLSSSASIEVVTFTLLEALSGIRTEPVRKAQLCQKAEHEFPGMPCGIMDQYVVTMAKKDHALLIDCRSLESTQVPIFNSDTAILVINTNVKHQLTGSEYPQRRAQCQAAADILGKPSLRGTTVEQLEDLKQSNCDADVLKRARHVVEEIRRSEEITKYFKTRDWERVGELLYESHESLRNLMEVSCPELDALVEVARATPGVYGARMTGGGFGGSVVVVVKKNSVDDLKKRVLSQYKGNPTFLLAIPSDGARIINI